MEDKITFEPTDESFVIGFKDFADEDCDIYHILVNGEQIGYLALKEYPKYLSLEGIEFGKPYRNKGYGKQVVKMLKEKYGRIYVRAIPDAKGFWDKQGHKSHWNNDSGTFDGMLDESVESAYIDDNGNMFEIHKNSSDKELKDLLKLSKGKALRVILTKNGDFYVADAYAYDHDSMEEKCKINGYRGWYDKNGFSVVDNGLDYFDDGILESVINVLKKYYQKFGKEVIINFIKTIKFHKLNNPEYYKKYIMTNPLIKDLLKNKLTELTESVEDKILYIIRGVPGSGKSTLAKTLTKNVVEADQFLYDENGEYVWTSERVREAHRKCQGTVRKYMEEGRSKIAVANTFIKLKDMKPYIKMAEENDYKIVVKSRPANKYIDYLDDINHRNIHNVDDEKLEDMKTRFQHNDEPVSFVAYHGGVDPNMTPYEDKPFYMCSTYKLAKAFAKREVYGDGLYDEDEIPTIFKFKGTFKHPYYMTQDEYDAGGQDSNIVPEWFIDNGYDGIILETDNTDTYYIAIDLSTIKCVGKKLLKVRWFTDDEEYNFGRNYEILDESVYYNDLAYNDFEETYEQLTVILNPSIEWLRNQLNSDDCWGFRFLHNTEKNKLYVWDCKQPWMHQQVFDMVDMDWGKNGTNVVGIFEPECVAVWEELAEDGEASSSIKLAKKLDGDFFKQLYPNGYQITICC